MSLGRRELLACTATSTAQKVFTEPDDAENSRCSTNRQRKRCSRCRQCSLPRLASTQHSSRSVAETVFVRRQRCSRTTTFAAWPWVRDRLFAATGSRKTLCDDGALPPTCATATTCTRRGALIRWLQSEFLRPAAQQADGPRWAVIIRYVCFTRGRAGCYIWWNRRGVRRDPSLGKTWPWALCLRAHTRARIPPGSPVDIFADDLRPSWALHSRRWKLLELWVPVRLPGRRQGACCRDLPYLQRSRWPSWQGEPLALPLPA
jgi:hypothetical protein